MLKIDHLFLFFQFLSTSFFLSFYLFYGTSPFTWSEFCLRQVVGGGGVVLRIFWLGRVERSLGIKIVQIVSVTYGKKSFLKRKFLLHSSQTWSDSGFISSPLEDRSIAGQQSALSPALICFILGFVICTIPEELSGHSGSQIEIESLMQLGLDPLTTHNNMPNNFSNHSCFNTRVVLKKV